MAVNQSQIWNREYSNSKLVTKKQEPQAFMLRFFKYLRKQGVKWSDLRVLDLGCGNGRNAIHLAKLGASAVGIDISQVAIDLARKNARSKDVDVDFRVGSMGEKFSFGDNNFNLVIDATSSNALSEIEREIYLSEVERMLDVSGYFFVRALCKDGDVNAKKLIKMYPGPEKDTYRLPNVGLVERVFTRDDFLETYSRFNIETMVKTTSYSKAEGQNYKRNFWICCMRKRK